MSQPKYLQQGERLYSTAKDMAISLLGSDLSELEILSHINSRTLSEELDMEIRDIGTIIRQNYSKNQQFEKIAELRKELHYELISEGKFTETKTKSFSERIYSVQGIKYDFHVPTHLTFNAAYLFGIYRGDAYAPKNKEFNILGTVDDFDFYECIVSGMLKEVFNLDLPIRPRITHSNGNEYVSPLISMYIKDHKKYLKKIGFLSDKNKFQHLQIENLIRDSSRIEEFYLSYFMGIIASQGNLTLRKQKNKQKFYLDFQSKNESILEDIERILLKLDLPFESLRRNKKSHLLRFDEENIIKMKDYKAPKIVQKQIGLFTNPKQVQIIELF